MRIAEIFYSIQGEGRFAGTATVFVRTTGCNLRCWFCDTPYTSWRPEGHQQGWESILEHVLDYGCEHVDVTGGEPLLQPEVVPLTHALGNAGKFVTIETAGTVYRPVYADLISLSPKLENSTPRGMTMDELTMDDCQRAEPSSINRQPSIKRWADRHARLRDNPQVVAQLLDEFPYQLKFVIDHPDDIDDVTEYLRQHPQVSNDRVWLMPQAVTPDEVQTKTDWLKVEAERRGYRVSPRLHIELYGNVRGK